MLNRVVLMGRITQNLELKQTPNKKSVLSFVLAVDRGFVKQGEVRQTDFITCVAWNQRAEFIYKYFGKGRMIALEGQLRTRTYDDKNGSRHYVTEVYVDNVSFTGEAKQNSASNSPSTQSPTQADKNEQPPESVSIGNLEDFEEILSDDGVPF